MQFFQVKLGERGTYDIVAWIELVDSSDSSSCRAVGSCRDLTRDYVSGMEHLSGRPIRQSSRETGDRDELMSRPGAATLARIRTYEAGRSGMNGDSTSR